MRTRPIQAIITIGALAVAVTHVAAPVLKVDAITVSLVLIAAVPWLAPLFKSLELPGGVKVEFRELERAMEKAERAGLLAPASAVLARPGDPWSPEGSADPNLALAGLRIEIEKRLRGLAEHHGIETKEVGIERLLERLARRGILTMEEKDVLEEVARMLGAAVHGAEIDRGAVSWARSFGPRILRSLEERMSRPAEPGTSRSRTSL